MPSCNNRQGPKRARLVCRSIIVVIVIAIAANYVATIRAADPARDAQRQRPRDHAKKVARSSSSNTSDSTGAVASAPLNDNCEDAFTILEGTTPFNTIEATTDGPDEPTVCDFFGETNVKQDIWFKHFATCTGNLTVSLCTNTDYDSRVAVYDNCDQCPPSPPASVCNDDACNLQSELIAPVTQGSCYLIRIGGHNVNEGSGELFLQCDVPPPPTGACCTTAGCESTLIEADCDTLGGSWFQGQSCPNFACPPPANDLCTDAIRVFTNTPFIGSNGAATGGDVTQECTVTDTADVWHVWTADCTGTATVSLCDTPVPFDTTLSVFDSCDGNELTCDDDACGFNSTSEVTFDAIQGESYYLRVAGFRDPKTGVAAMGEYRLTVEGCPDNSPRACCGGPNVALCVNNVAPAQCLTFTNGTPQAPGTVCGGDMEACCFDDGSCTDMDPTCCMGQGGTPGGPLSTCLSDGDGDGVDDACAGVIDTVTWKDFNGELTGGYLPDFDQNQDFDNADGDAILTTGVDNFYGGPAAAADLLWWMNAKYPTLDIVPAAMTPDLLAQNLASNMATNAQTQSAWGHAGPYAGTWLDDFRTGLRAYLNSRGLSDVFDLTVEASPTFDSVANTLLADDNIALLIGFYHVESVTEIPDSGYLVNWRRTGGHYAALAGVDLDNLKIGLSDPDADAAEEGAPGQVRGADHDHDEDANPGTSLAFRDPSYNHTRHNVKDLASHDVLGVVLNNDPSSPTAAPVPGGKWFLHSAGDALLYGADLAPFHVESSGGAFDVDVATFMSNSFLMDNSLTDPAVCQTYAVIEAAIVMSPRATNQACCLADGSCDDVAPVDCALANGTRRGPDTFCLSDTDTSGADDACEACPSITLVSAYPPNGTIDARQPHGPNAVLSGQSTAEIGSSLEPIQVSFDQSVSGLARCLTLCESNPDPFLGPNAIAGVNDLGNGDYEIVLDHGIAAGQATALDFGSGVVDYLSHPANVDGDTAANGADVSAMVDCCLLSQCGPGWDKFRCDIDRSGTATPADILRVIDLLGGGASWATWNGTARPTPPTCP